jgi:acetylornithine deacetylase/succinyl-diaminopimelate desuccinylase-like protein
MRWLLENHRALLDAELALNEGGGFGYRGGKPILAGLQTAEKVSTNFVLEVKNKGGHSSLPTRENAIYRLSEALVRLARHEFPVKLNETTRASLAHTASVEEPEMARAIRAVLASAADPDAVARVSTNPVYGAQLRTTCVATLVEAGHASNALPQAARATVNCRVLPGESVDEVQRTLVRVIADEQVAVTSPSRGVPSPLSPVEPGLFRAVERAASELWPGARVVPTMLAGATDGSFLRNAGIPTYGTGFAVDLDDIRAHGKDERMAVEDFYKGTEYLYRLVKLLSSGAPGS